MLEMFSSDNAEAYFLAIGKHTLAAEKIAKDLYFSGDETYKCYAARQLGFIDGSKKHLFVDLYRAEKQHLDSYPDKDIHRNFSNQLIEILVVATVVRFDLMYQKFLVNTRSARLGSDWVNCLFEVVADAMNGYAWSAFPWALSILAFHFYNKKWFKVLLVKYEEFVVQTSDETHIRLLDEIKTRNGETEIFENLLNEVVIPKLIIANDYKINDYEISTINDIAVFMKNRS
ncbi:MAG: hypothetical protein LBE91_14515 [Tannerella sp.]|nr:hypothetical protein [Tannerella sp.]